MSYLFGGYFFVCLLWWNICGRWDLFCFGRSQTAHCPRANTSISWNEWSVYVLAESGRKVRRLPMNVSTSGNISSILWPAVQVRFFYSPGMTFNISTLVVNLKSWFLIMFIPLLLVTVMFPFTAWLWVMNVALPNRQAGTRLPLKMPDVTKSIINIVVPLYLCLWERCTGVVYCESNDVMHEYL